MELVASKCIECRLLRVCSISEGSLATSMVTTLPLDLQ